MPALPLVDMLSQRYPLASDDLFLFADTEAFWTFFLGGTLVLSAFWFVVVQVLVRSHGKAVIPKIVCAAIFQSILTGSLLFLDYSVGLVSLWHLVSLSAAPYCRYLRYLAAALFAAWFSRHVKTLSKVIANQRDTIANQQAKLTTLDVSLRGSRANEDTLLSDVTRFARKVSALKHKVSTLKTERTAKTEDITDLRAILDHADAHLADKDAALDCKDTVIRNQASASRVKITDLKIALYAARSAAADKEAGLTQAKAALKNTQSVLRDTRSEIKNVHEAATTQAHELKDELQLEKIRGCTKDAARKACEDAHTSVLANKDAVIGDLKAAHEVALYAGQTQTKMIVKLAVKAKSLEEQLAVSLKTRDAQGQLEGPSTKDAIISAQEEYLAVKDIKLARLDDTIAKLAADLARADDTISQLQSKSADAEVPPPTESFSTTTTPPAPHAPLQEQMLDAVVDENARLYTQVADLQQQVDTLMDEAIIRSWESNAQEGEWMAREKDMRGLICSLYSIIQESGLAPTSSPSSSPSSSGSANSSATLVDEPTTSCASPCTTEAAVSGQDEQDLEEQQETVLSTSASSILRSGQLLASDSLANVVTSSSSEMLFKMEFGILEDISFTSEVTEPTSSLTSSSSADVQAALTCESTSTVQQDGSEEEAPVLPASTSAILRSGQVLASDSLQGIVLSISSEMLFNVDFDLLEDMSFTEDTEPTSSLTSTSTSSADVQAALPCESTSTAQQDGSEEEAPVLPASTSAILRSGQILASDSLQGIVLSISSEMLFNVDFDLPADTSFVLFESTTSSEASLAPASSSHIVASITADMLSNVTLDLPPATPCARRSSGPLVESPMKMVVSSSSQLLSRVTFDLPPSSPG